MSTIPALPRLLLTLILLLLSPLTSSQIYSWVDENGKQHFGDQIPPQYQDQAQEYDVPETNSSEAVEVDTSRPTGTSRPRSAAGDGASDSAQPSLRSSKPAGNSCADLKAAYAESQRCFTACRMRGNNNIANCGHCTQMKKPDCR